MAVDCSVATEVAKLLAGSGEEVVFAKLGDMCIVEPSIDLSCSGSVRRWQTFLNYVYELCGSPSRFVFNAITGYGIKIPKEYLSIVPIVECYGFSVRRLSGRGAVIETTPELFCLAIKSSLLRKHFNG